MKKTNFVLPLSLDNIAALLGKEDKVEAEIQGIIMVKKNKNETKFHEAIREHIFKSVTDEWKAERSVVVGDNKLLTTVDLRNYEIIEQADALENFVVMNIKAHIGIEQDPAYAKEIKSGIRTDNRLKFR